jgi:hypothetical protein
MSAWRIVVRSLYEMGPATSGMVELHTGGTNAWIALRDARVIGLVSSPEKKDGTGLWSLTPIGVDWCEGRVTSVSLRPGGRRWVSTWLSALPRGLRITPRDAGAPC